MYVCWHDDLVLVVVRVYQTRGVAAAAAVMVVVVVVVVMFKAGFPR